MLSDITRFKLDAARLTLYTIPLLMMDEIGLILDVPRPGTDNLSLRLDVLRMVLNTLFLKFCTLNICGNFFF